MALYFDTLPSSLKQLLLLYIPPPYLMYEYHPSRFANHIFNIFDLDTFKPCDNDYLWKILYGELSTNSVSNYKHEWQRGALAYIQNLMHELHTALELGHNNIIIKTIIRFPDLWLDYEALFIKAITLYNFDAMRLIDKYTKLDRDTYQLALNNFCLHKCYDYNSHKDKIDSMIKYLLERKVTLPPLNLAHSPPLIGINALSSSWINRGVLDFLLTYYPNMDMKAFLKYICSAYFINSELIPYFIEKSGQQIDSDIFRHVAVIDQYGEHRSIKILLNLNYFPTRTDMIYLKNHAKSAAEYITHYYSKKDLKRKKCQ